ncbi:MAG TPA: 5-bromo-4-chloroindolyl phosphate hydrolysis family protein [Candidatus Competibacteraceae bacterium]|nr:5-bromo-4-chloroindolyl phosphate hydrolysis family protein [Candidatus Competibacteraceae bacterium]MCP5134398.1 5-bromo-4-chloroindolyl phosphate hydrolysis family protein [Gammaproteobacteria bacterium]HPF57820.1 5-bromo-4-chloroindolyl phosphate hydrolysis family protein [Candidatus Competibacteraceae bacterium]HRY17390.1 5-bromo-4-chloroindolyl phosphate hydrolysis family protein [Candidatus Competibacteraceae bacterium]
MGRFILLASVILIPFTALFLLIKQTIQTMAERYRLPSGQLPSTKGLLMFLLPLPVLAAALMSLARGQLGPLIGDAAGYGLFLAGALLLRRGLLSQSEYDRRRIAKTPWPFKTLGSGLIALATGVTAWLGVGHHPAIGGAFSLVAFLGCYLCYGFDPRSAKRFTDGYGVDATEHVLKALAQAECSITAIEEAARDIRNAELNARLQRIAQLARDILKMLEEDPRDLRRARKFLNVYLDGAQKVTEGYAKTHSRVAAPELDDNFRRVLATIEEVFQEQQQKLLESDLTDLDIQIEVLTAQLKREGVI